MLRHVVHLSKKTDKGLRKAPRQVQEKAAFWKKLVETRGLPKARQIKGFHDEPLEGDRKGQRSIRLNIQWRAIYVSGKSSLDEEEIELVEVIEVNPHRY